MFESDELEPGIECQPEEQSREIICDCSDATAELLPMFRELTKAYYEVTPLDRYRIKFLFCHKERKAKGRQTLGTAKPFPAKAKLIHDWDAVITFDYLRWQAASPTQRKALMFHELCHLEVNEEKAVLTSVDHDVTEFYAVWKRFGDWQGELKYANTCQLELNLNIVDDEALGRL
jgi:Putative phage metallopeptidase